uniref:Ig-like domain-containing protein n=1 Tax=Electrophorus electricus TaxID=8005 RepID=A0AAY5EE88_ELEEL
MKLSLIFLTLTGLTCTNAQVQHVDIQLSGCTESDKETLWANDGDEVANADFIKQAMVMKIPDFADPFTESGLYDLSVSEQAVCKHNLQTAAQAYKNPPEAVDPPQSSIYTKADVQLDTENTLICHVTGFFPPPVAVTWTKNNLNVTDSSTLTRFYPNEDGTYNQFSHLRFTPQSGDIYSCTVQHKGLETPNTKTWEVDVSVPSVGPSVFCGVGLAAGLLGVATGTFFLIKGNQCN